MAQNRKPPAYQEYPATMLASRNFKLMNIAERGLLYTIRLECWENIQVPASPDELAKYISCDVSDVKAALTDRVKSFLSEKENSLICPELEDYRQHLAERREKQSKGGKDGAAITNRSKKRADKEVNANQLDGSGNSQASRRGTDGSLVKSSTFKSSHVKTIEGGYIDDPFVRDIISYDEASNGK